MHRWRNWYTRQLQVLVRHVVSASSSLARCTKTKKISAQKDIFVFVKICPADEIGRHAGFRFLCLKACGFESRAGHQKSRRRRSVRNALM